MCWSSGNAPQAAAHSSQVFAHASQMTPANGLCRDVSLAAVEQTSANRCRRSSSWRGLCVLRSPGSRNGDNTRHTNSCTPRRPSRSSQRRRRARADSCAAGVLRSPLLRTARNRIGINDQRCVSWQRLPIEEFWPWMLLLILKRACAAREAILWAWGNRAVRGPRPRHTSWSFCRVPGARRRPPRHTDRGAPAARARGAA